MHSVLADEFASTAYGADGSGLTCGYLFDAAGGAQPLSAADAADWLAASPLLPESGSAPFAWLHFNLAHVAAERWLTRHAGLSDTFFEVLRDGLYSTRIERSEQSLIAVINNVHFDFSFDASDISTLWISVDRRLVLTSRRLPLRSVDRLRTAVKRGETIRSTGDLLERLMRAQADVLVGIVRSVTGRVDQIEDKLLAGRLDHKRARLGELRRRRRAAGPERARLLGRGADRAELHCHRRLGGVSQEARSLGP